MTGAEVAKVFTVCAWAKVWILARENEIKVLIPSKSKRVQVLKCTLVLCYE